MVMFGIWTMIVALVISGVAAYYSIIGLVAIFSSAFVPIVIMGAALELGKLTTAVWLHLNWNQAKLYIKTYLSFALLILMFITSMGIFGFLSKAHIEQTSASKESVEQVKIVETEILRYKDIISRANERIVETENSGQTKNNSIQDQIDREQERIETAYDRVQPQIDKQNELIDREIRLKEERIKPYQKQVENIDADLEILNNLLSRRDSESIKRLQSIIGTRVDGRYGSRTAEQVDSYRNKLISKRDSVLRTIERIQEKESTLAQQARQEISRLQKIAESEIKDSNKLINKLRQQIGVVTTVDNSEFIEAQNKKIKDANIQIDILTEQKYKLQAEYRKLEAEVGPVKYIAEFVYGDKANSDMLEEAVRWVIVLLVIVFDPLAVVLVIAGLSLIEKRKPRQIKDSKQEIINEDAQITPQDVEGVGTGEEEQSTEIKLDDYREDSEEKEEELKFLQTPTEKIDEEPEVVIENKDVNIESESKETKNPYTELSEKIGQPVHRDENGFYTLNQEGDKNYVVDPEQQKLNATWKEAKKLENTKDQIDKTIMKMKQEGRWPNSPDSIYESEADVIRDIMANDKSGELEDLLDKADEKTLKEVYDEMLKDLNKGN